MKKGNLYIIPVLGFVLTTILFSQGNGYLSQKLMVENNIRDRVKDALSKVIDSHKYVINVDVELEILDEVNEQITVFAPRDHNKKEKDQTPAEETASALVRIQEKMMQETDSYEEESYSIGLPIPGFEVDVTRPKEGSRPLKQSKPISPKTMEAIDRVEENTEPNNELVDKVLSRKRPSRAEIKRMDLSLILQEGAAPELIENIRQLTMTASKFDRDRGDKLTIMTASFKERRDQRSAEQIMLKNIAEKIDLLEKKRVAESTDWRSDIEKYKEEITTRREEDMAALEGQLQELDKKRLAEAAEYEKREMARRDSVRNSKLETEIKALKEMLTVNEESKLDKEKELDSSRFAMLDNELQGLRKMLLSAMLQDSIEAQKLAQQKIESELQKREQEKASRDSLIAEKIAALDAAAEKVSLEAESSSGLSTSTVLLIALGLLSLLLIIALIVVLTKNKQQNVPPMQPYMYPPPPRRRKRRKLDRPKKNEEKTIVKEVKKEEVKVSTPTESAIESEKSEEINKDKKELVKKEEDESDDLVSVEDDPNVLKSEIDDIRKSIVSMSVGQPERTSTIVKEWLEQPAPEPPVAAETNEESPATEEPTEDK
jgi:flagellar biosynthesis/type III secretory pathway M-ring protein FliF/YscJ